jgi:hypothetical protein
MPSEAYAMLITPLLPYPNFRQSVACYSDGMLEITFQLIVVNCCVFGIKDRNLNWNQRDMMHLWKGRKQAFIRLGLMCAEEAEQRGVDPGLGKQELEAKKKDKYWLKPMWAGWERLHSEHRAVLLQHEETVRIQHRIAQRISGPENWLHEQGWSNLESRCGRDIIDVNRFLDIQGFAPLEGEDCPNHYAQFNWAEEPNGKCRVCPP